MGSAFHGEAAKYEKKTNIFTFLLTNH